MESKLHAQIVDRVLGHFNNTTPRYVRDGCEYDIDYGFKIREVKRCPKCQSMGDVRFHPAYFRQHSVHLVELVGYNSVLFWPFIVCKTCRLEKYFDPKTNTQNINDGLNAIDEALIDEWNALDRSHYVSLKQEIVNRIMDPEKTWDITTAEFDVGFKECYDGDYDLILHGEMICYRVSKKFANALIEAIDEKLIVMEFDGGMSWSAEKYDAIQIIPHKKENDDLFRFVKTYYVGPKEEEEDDE